MTAGRKSRGISSPPGLTRVTTLHYLCLPCVGGYIMQQAMRRVTSWYPGRSTCVSLVSVRERLVQKDFKGTKNADRFLFGNACLQVRGQPISTTR